MWVAGGLNCRIFAFRMSDKSYDAGKSVDLDFEDCFLTGLWADGTTMWVANDLNGAERIHAYSMSDWSRDSDKDIYPVAGNYRPAGIWSDGTTMWVGEYGSEIRIFAYNLAAGSRDPDKDFTHSFLSTWGTTTLGRYGRTERPGGSATSSSASFWLTKCLTGRASHSRTSSSEAATAPLSDCGRTAKRCGLVIRLGTRFTPIDCLAHLRFQRSRWLTSTKQGALRG